MYDYTRIFSLALRQALGFHSHEMKKAGLNSGFIPYLMCVYENPGITQEGVSEKTTFDKSTVAKMIKQLVAAGFIVREVDDDDKRAYNLFATAKADSLVAKMRETITRWHSHITQDMTEIEKLVLGMLLDKLHLQ